MQACTHPAMERLFCLARQKRLRSLSLPRPCPTLTWFGLVGVTYASLLVQVQVELFYSLVFKIFRVLYLVQLIS